MKVFKNADGKPVLFAMVKVIQENKEYLGEIDGFIGDGDHGMNMNKGFSLFEERYKNKNFTFTEGLDGLGTILFSEIGGSMGPIYGSFLCGTAEAGKGYDGIGVNELTKMFKTGLDELCDIVEAKVGDKTLIDSLQPSIDSLSLSVENNHSFVLALENMIKAAEKGRDSTKNLQAKFGRSSRLGERSIGVLDAGATSCCLILVAIATSMLDNIQ